jgi:tryptophanyl-tRNA synthetase
MMYNLTMRRKKTMATRRILTGMRTTGRLHLGHYVGALKMWKEMQDRREYECFFLLADVQALTTHASNPEILTESVRQVVLDWLAVGLDPAREDVNFVLQSQIPERHELSILLSMIARYREVANNPTLKDELKRQKKATVGFMAYPVDQVADILMVSPWPIEYGDELIVPVGEDQAPHLEYARRLAGRFNKQYGKTFLRCRTEIGEVGRLVGLDGSDKMGKSLDNAIFLSDDPETVERKVRGMFTDPKRTRADIPGTVEGNPVFIYHDAFNPDKEEVEDLKTRYRAGKVGDVEVKKKLAAAINATLDPIRERREIAEKEADIGRILRGGTGKARVACQTIVAEVRQKMFLRYP